MGMLWVAYNCDTFGFHSAVALHGRAFNVGSGVVKCWFDTSWTV